MGGGSVGDELLREQSLQPIPPDQHQAKAGEAASADEATSAVAADLTTVALAMVLQTTAEETNGQPNGGNEAQRPVGTPIAYHPGQPARHLAQHKAAKARAVG